MTRTFTGRFEANCDARCVQRAVEWIVRINQPTEMYK